MRIWSLHPRHLDRAALVAGWREALLAQAVLAGRTRGYRHHPQLERFQAHAHPLMAIDAYLRALHEEATARGYRFDASKFDPGAKVTTITVTSGQMQLEWAHLLRKVEERSPQWLPKLLETSAPACHPLFRIIEGPVASWERAVAASPAVARGAAPP